MSKTIIGAVVAALFAFVWIVTGNFWAALLVIVIGVLGALVGGIIEGKINIRNFDIRKLDIRKLDFKGAYNALLGRKSS